MHDLIYFSPGLLSRIDNDLLDSSYRHNYWFELSGSANHYGVKWPTNMSSRVHALDTPWPQAKTPSPIPDAVTVTDSFQNVMDQIAHRVVELCRSRNLKPYVLWSGGLDSTAILTALLKLNNRDFLDSLTVVMSQHSKQENAYFYHYFIQDKLDVMWLDQFCVDQNNFDKILVLDGDAGNQVFGCSTIYDVFYRQPELLNHPWQTCSSVQDLLPGAAGLAWPVVKQSLAHAPVPIQSVYDLLWWSNFNFKWDEVLIRSMYFYGQRLDASQRQCFFDQHLFRFFAQPVMQQWAMCNKDLRRQHAQQHPKWHVSRYIFEFDHNDLWHAHKQEAASGSPQTRATPIYQPTTIIGFDQEWNVIDLAHRSHRQKLASWLDRG